jgi:hypothetical protein
LTEQNAEKDIEFPPGDPEEEDHSDDGTQDHTNSVPSNLQHQAASQNKTNNCSRSMRN